jgi:ribosome-binding factor A
VSVIGQPEEREHSLAALRRALPYVRHLLGQRVRLRRIPELHLKLDETAERGTRVLQLLADLEAGSTPEEDRPASESLPTPVPRLRHEGDAVEADAAGQADAVAPEPDGAPELDGAPERGR